MELKGRSALITGAGRGLGAAISFVFARAGVRVVLSGRDMSALDRVADLILAATGQRPRYLELDLSRPGGWDRAALSSLDIDILVNNGAKWLPGSLESASEDDIAETIASQLTGTMFLTRWLLPALKRKPHADIVNIVSVSGLPNVPLNGASPPFHAAKHGQSGFSDGLRQALIGTSVRVTAIHPPQHRRHRAQRAGVGDERGTAKGQPRHQSRHRRLRGVRADAAPPRHHRQPDGRRRCRRAFFDMKSPQPR